MYIWTYNIQFPQCLCKQWYKYKENINFWADIEQQQWEHCVYSCIGSKLNYLVRITCNTWCAVVHLPPACSGYLEQMLVNIFLVWMNYILVCASENHSLTIKKQDGPEVCPIKWVDLLWTSNFNCFEPLRFDIWNFSRHNFKYWLEISCLVSCEWCKWSRKLLISSLLSVVSSLNTHCIALVDAGCSWTSIQYYFNQNYTTLMDWSSSQMGVYLYVYGG